EFLLPGVEEWRLPAEVMEQPVVPHHDLLAVHREEEGWLAGVEGARVADHPAPHQAHAQVLALDVVLRILPLAGRIFCQADPHRAAAERGLDYLRSRRSRSRYRDSVPGQDLTAPYLVCADGGVHAPAPHAVCQPLEERGELEEEVIGGYHEAHVA